MSEYVPDFAACGHNNHWKIHDHIVREGFCPLCELKTLKTKLGKAKDALETIKLATEGSSKASLMGINGMARNGLSHLSGAETKKSEPKKPQSYPGQAVCEKCGLCWCVCSS